MANSSDPLSLCFRMPMKATDLQEALLAAYGRLTQCDLILFLSLRSLPTQGSASDLARRLVQHDLAFYRGMEMQVVEEREPQIARRTSSSNPTSNGRSTTQSKASSVEPGRIEEENELAVEKSTDTIAGEANNYHNNHSSGISETKSAMHRVPPELWSEVFEQLGDWQIATALRVRTRLKRPWDWVNATDLDVAILTGSLSEVKQTMYRDRNKDDPMQFTDAGADAMVRWGYVNLLDFFFHNSYRNFLEVFQRDYTPPNEVALRMEIPWLASRYGQTKVLDWWLANSSPNRSPPHMPNLPTSNNIPLPPLYRRYDEGALNQASWQGHIPVLQWWKDSGLPLRIGDVMDWATIGGHISVLEWWKHSGENTNIMHRDAMCIASTRGKIEFLEWFRNSGLQLTYGNDILGIITRKNMPQSLEWWAQSGLRIEYAISDIWEAIEDAQTRADEARDWWLARGVEFDNYRMDSEEWMRLRVL
ncbi:hypothetical protein DFH27DRAFT_183748 [Peziza echinospora]|nr:hypothetical protein DFH27DRAFT_183748 [Peziza echinospora]